jgi:hypothetical protein
MNAGLWFKKREEKEKDFPFSPVFSVRHASPPCYFPSLQGTLAQAPWERNCVAYAEASNAIDPFHAVVLL